MRGMRQASNRAAKTAISFQCWVQESERGTSASWTDSISTGDFWGSRPRCSVIEVDLRHHGGVEFVIMR